MAYSDDAVLLAALRAGSEEAFRHLVSCHHGAMVRVARSYVASEAVAEEVTQDTWIGVLRGLEGFEGRSSLKTWIFSVLTNQARSQGAKEHRSVPTSFVDELDERSGPQVEPSRFRTGADDPFEGYWRTPPARFSSLPEEQVTSAETRTLIDDEIRGLPLGQQQVVTLRDIEGWSAAEVCAALGLSEGNQRVLLHRARARLRQQLEAHLSPAAAS